MFHGPEIPMSIMFLSLGAIFVLRGPLGKALAERLAGRARTDDAEIRELREGLDEVRAELTAVQERLDFAERLLAQQKEAGALPPGGRR